jgi:hypothetical protein
MEVTLGPLPTDHTPAHQTEFDRFGSVLSFSIADHQSETWMQIDDEELFYKVPRKITSFVFGQQPGNVCTLELDFDEEHDSLIFRVGDTSCKQSKGK